MNLIHLAKGRAEDRPYVNTVGLENFGVAQKTVNFLSCLESANLFNKNLLYGVSVLDWLSCSTI